jgi:hypothetical protein
LANEGGGHDNITVLLVRIDPADAPHERSDAPAEAPVAVVAEPAAAVAPAPADGDAPEIEVTGPEIGVSEMDEEEALALFDEADHVEQPVTENEEPPPQIEATAQRLCTDCYYTVGAGESFCGHCGKPVA